MSCGVHEQSGRTGAPCLRTRLPCGMLSCLTLPLRCSLLQCSEDVDHPYLAPELQTYPDRPQPDCSGCITVVFLL